MKRNIFRGLILILTSVVCFSCKGLNDPPAKQPAKNQYGRTGNFKGTLGGGIADQQVTVAVKKGGEQLPLLLQQTALEVLQDLHK